MRGRNEALRAKLRGTPRKQRVLYGSVGMIGSLVVLLGGLVLIGNFGGLNKDGLTLWAWPLAAMLGLLFVHMQVLGAASMITLVQDEETARRFAASEEHRGE